MIFLLTSPHLLLPMIVFLISSSFTQLAGATACDDEISAFSLSLLTSNVCDEQTSDGSCTATCATTLSKVHEVCDGTVITNEDGDEEPYSLTSAVMGFGFLMPAACSDALMDWMLSRNDIPCSEWLTLNAAGAILLCSEECTDQCKAIINKVYTTCNENDTVEDEDGKTITARQVEQGVALFRHAECEEYAQTLSFQGNKNTDTSPAYITHTTSNHVLAAAFLFYLF